MSESSVELSVVFNDVDTSTALENLLTEAKETILTAFKNSDKLYLHDFLNQKNQTMGISFDSWWVIEKLERSDNIINISLSGSPSGTKEQDIITWFREMGATKVSGRMTVDGGGDVESWKVGDSVEDDDEEDGEWDVGYRDGAGHSLLHLAVEMGNAERAQLLIDKGADIEARNKAGGTPLFMAVNDDISYEEAVECIDVLLNAGANINAKGIRDLTPMGWAKRWGNKKIAKYLKSRGAKGGWLFG
jgi:hypothetical protein